MSTINESCKYDAIIIGAGHNGLVAASYLVKQGLRTIVFERRGVVGGACVTEELFPDTKVSTGACWFGMFRPQIIEDLKLAAFGFQSYPMDPQLTALFPGGHHISFWLSKMRTRLSLVRDSGLLGLRDIVELDRFSRFADRVLCILGPLLTMDPLSLEDMRVLFRKEGIEDAFAMVFEWSVAQLLQHFFSSERLRAAHALGALAISNRGPFERGTAYHLFFMLLACTGNKEQAWGFVRGGMGMLTTALSRSAESLGVKIVVNAEVDAILINAGAVDGVRLTDKREIHAGIVMSNADPVATFTRLLQEADLPSEFSTRIKAIKIRGSGGIAHFLVSDFPRFTGFPLTNVPGPEHRGLIAIAPSLDVMNRAWLASNDGRFPDEPILTVGIQSVTDTSITPLGKHLVSVFTQFVPYELSEPYSKNQAPLDVVTDLLDRYAPGFRGSIQDTAFLGPKDLEQRFGLTGGHPEHGDMIIEQLFQARPCQGYDCYRSPVHGLYLCGSGSHPGGTVTGAPGLNAARKVLHDIEEGLLVRPDMAQEKGPGVCQN